MVSQAGTLTLQQDQDLIPVRDNLQEDSRRKATQMQSMHLQSHDQASMAHQGKTGKYHKNGKITKKMRLDGPTGATASRIPIPNQGKTYQAGIHRFNSLC